MNTRMINGYVWPADDIECAKVAFLSTAEMGPALGLCRQTKLAVQAGGNCGVWPNYLALRFARVVTFEADPMNFYCLEQNCTAPNIEAHACGLGAKFERVGMARDPRNVGAHYVEGAGDTEIVPLDSLGLPACDFLCLDIEGYEMRALLGANATIERHRPVIQIEDKGLSVKYGTPKGAAEAWLSEAFGYRVVKRIGKDVVLAC